MYLRTPAFFAIALLLAAAAQADHMEELVVTASHDTRTIDIADEVIASPDVAQLLRKAPGADVNSNGPITGIAQYRGMYGSRIATTLDGMELASAGPNAMDPPLSYTVGGQLESLLVYRGIAPVSVAQESIGGAVVAQTFHGEFAAPGESVLTGRTMGGLQSVNNAFHLEGSLFAASDSQRLKLAAMTEQGDDADFPGGKIIPSEYERQRYDLGYGLRSGNHSLQLDYGFNDTGNAGTPALPMDIELIEGRLYRAQYQFEGKAGLQINAHLFGSDLDHTMTNFHLRTAPAAPRWRRNTAAAENRGFKLDVVSTDADGAWNLGVDGFREDHDSDIDNPNNPMFFVINFNSAKREVLGLFLERTHNFGDDLRAEVGLRYNRVETDAGEVNGTPAMMMPPAMALRDAFNNADRQQSDDNVDLVAKTWFDLSDSSSLYLGAAHKTRSPAYQERYLWLPLEATGGLADGRLYTGNIDLDPEVSRQLELGLDYSGSRLTVSPRLFYSNIKDYIQGTPSESASAIMFVRMMNNMNGTANADPLQFNNVDAELYGFDMDWAWQLSDHWSLSGLVNYVRGERDDNSGDNLYRIAPPSATLRLHYRSAAWSAQIEGVGYTEQDNVSATNSELESDSYELVNLLLNWHANQQLQLSVGVDNVFDERYEPHLGGYNRAQNPDVALRERLPSTGLNAFARVRYQF